MEMISIGESVDIAERLHVILSFVLMALLTWRAWRHAGGRGPGASEGELEEDG